MVLKNVKNIDEFLPGKKVFEQESQPEDPSVDDNDSESESEDDEDDDYDNTDLDLDDTGGDTSSIDGDLDSDDDDAGIDSDQDTSTSLEITQPVSTPAIPAPSPLGGVTPPIATTDYNVKPYLALQNIKKLNAQTNEILAMLANLGELDRWAEDNITKASTEVDEVYSFLKYGKPQ